MKNPPEPAFRYRYCVKCATKYLTRGYKCAWCGGELEIISKREYDETELDRE